MLELVTGSVLDLRAITLWVVRGNMAHCRDIAREDAHCVSGSVLVYLLLSSSLMTRAMDGHF